MDVGANPNASLAKGVASPPAAKRAGPSPEGTGPAAQFVENRPTLNRRCAD